jgi:transketolase
VRCVSMPSWDLFEAQPPKLPRRGAAAGGARGWRSNSGATQGWHRYVGERGDVLGIDHFGASAPAEVLLREFGFTVDNVVARAHRLLATQAISPGS